MSPFWVTPTAPATERIQFRLHRHISKLDGYLSGIGVGRQARNRNLQHVPRLGRPSGVPSLRAIGNTPSAESRMAVVNSTLRPAAVWIATESVVPTAASGHAKLTAAGDASTTPTGDRSGRRREVGGGRARRNVTESGMVSAAVLLENARDPVLLRWLPAAPCRWRCRRPALPPFRIGWQKRT